MPYSLVPRVGAPTSVTQIVLSASPCAAIILRKLGTVLYIFCQLLPLAVVGESGEKYGWSAAASKDCCAPALYRPSKKRSARDVAVAVGGLCEAAEHDMSRAGRRREWS